jgi:phosphatidylglycerol:prolipoprotein diacylglycerol transferase
MAHPVLFTIGDFAVESYPFFVILGLIAGAITVKFFADKIRVEKEKVSYLFMAALVGGVLGAKIPVWIINFKEISALRGLDWAIAVLSGRTIIGGIIGGILAVLIVKTKLGIKYGAGDPFAPALAISLAIGRIGCFLRGCCYGKETSLPWASYSHDAYRHPTQLYEVLFHSVAFIMMLVFMKRYDKLVKKKVLYPGDMFKMYIVAYCFFRFMTEFIRADTIPFVLGMSVAQFVCLTGLLLFLIYFLTRFIKNNSYK